MDRTGLPPHGLPDAQLHPHVNFAIASDAVDGDDFFDYDAFSKDHGGSPRYVHTHNQHTDCSSAERVDITDEPGFQDLIMQSEGIENIDSCDEPDDAAFTNVAVVNAARRSYFANNPLQDTLVQSLAADDLDRSSTPSRLTGDVDLTAFNGPERWEVDKQSVQFLSSVVALNASTEFDPTALRPKPSFRDLRMEEPALRTDPQMDMIKLVKNTAVEVSTKGIEPFHLDVERDHGLEWSKKSRELPALLNRKVATEKLEVDHETAEYLGRIYRDPELDIQEYLAKDRKQIAWRRPFSPPLLPLSPHFSPGSLSTSAAEVELMSTPDDPTVREAAELQDELWEQDEAFMEECHNEIINNAQYGRDVVNDHFSAPVVKFSSPLKRKAQSLQSLKVSSPVLPEELAIPAAKRVKIVSFQDEITTLTPHDTSEDSKDLHAAADEAMAAVIQIITPLAAPAIDGANNEQLNAFDTILRVPVPAIDEILPAAPWDLGQEKASVACCNTRLLQSTRDEIMKVERKWSGASRVERDLPWTPFPSYLGKIKPEGDFDHGSCTGYLSELQFDGEVDLESLVWNMEGFRILDPEEVDEDEIVPPEYDSFDHEEQPPIGNFKSTPPILIRQSHAEPKARIPDTPSVLSTNTIDSRSSMEALLAQRRIAIEQRGIDLRIQASQRVAVLNSNSAIRNETVSSSSPIQEVPNRSGLFNFAKLQGWVDVPEPTRVQKPHSITKPTNLVSIAPTTTPPPTNIPTPHLHASVRPLSLILSARTITNRPLIRQLTSLLPNLNIIERDYTHPNSKASSPSLEADITLSPSTGVLLTALQKLKQRPLPSQTPSLPNFTSPFTTLLPTISPRYERLILLITDTRSPTHPTLDKTDTSTLNDIINFTSTLDTSIEVILIPGPESTLEHWLAATILKYAYSEEEEEEEGDPIALLQNETHWERFLRKAGLNAFAAQIVLAQVKRMSSAVGGGDADERGLAAFVAMSPDERIERFVGVMGGERVLARVNRALEGRWLSASNEVG